jgi:hypothetical protein
MFSMNAAKPVQERRSFTEKILIRLNQSQGLALYHDLLKKDTFRPTFGLTTFLIYLLAAIVYLFEIVFFVLAVYILIHGYQHIATLVLAVVLFGLAWFARPRFRQLPKHPLDKHNNPHLYQVVAILAKSMSTHVDVIDVNEEYNAGVYLAGLRQTRVLTLGLPAMVVLTNEEKAALICH